MLLVNNKARTALESVLNSTISKIRVGELIPCIVNANDYKNEYHLNYTLYAKCVNKIEQLLDTDRTCFYSDIGDRNHMVRVVDDFLEQQGIFSNVKSMTIDYEAIEDVMTSLLELYRSSCIDIPDEIYDVMNTYIENECKDTTEEVDVMEYIIEFFFFLEAAFLEPENEKLLNDISQLFCEELFQQFSLNNEELIQNDVFVYSIFIIIKDILFSEDGYGYKNAYVKFDVYESHVLYTLLKNEEDTLLDLCMSSLKSIQPTSFMDMGGVIVSDKNETVYLFVLADGCLADEYYGTSKIKLSLFVCLRFFEKIARDYGYLNKTT